VHAESRELGRGDGREAEDDRWSVKVESPLDKDALVA
jgi:hypothetical protein